MAAGAVRSHHVNIGSALKRVPRAAAHIENCAFDVTKSGLLAWHRHGTSLMATSLGKAQEHKSLGYVTQGDTRAGTLDPYLRLGIQDTLNLLHLG